MWSKLGYSPSFNAMAGSLRMIIASSSEAVLSICIALSISRKCIMEGIAAWHLEIDGILWENQKVPSQVWCIKSQSQGWTTTSAQMSVQSYIINRWFPKQPVAPWKDIMKHEYQLAAMISGSPAGYCLAEWLPRTWWKASLLDTQVDVWLLGWGRWHGNMSSCGWLTTSRVDSGGISGSKSKVLSMLGNFSYHQSFTCVFLIRHKTWMQDLQKGYCYCLG